MRATLLALVFVAGCAAAPETPATPPSLRDAAAPLGSQTDVNADGLAGDWAVRRTLPDGAFVPGERFSLTASGADLTLVWLGIVCSDVVGLCEAFTGTATYARSGPGRWRRTSAVPYEEVAPLDLWIFWTDGDRRTMAFGDPAGSYALIADRNATGGADRIAAAREILDWYGFDVAMLRTVGP